MKLRNTLAPFFVSFGAAFLLCLTDASADAPANDNFANRTVLSGTPVIGTSTTVDATRESFEPTFDSNPGSTVWFTWTAPSDGTVNIDTGGSGVNDPYLSIFNGDTIDTLKVVTNTRSGNDGTTVIQFPTVAGTVYQISVGSDTDDEDTVKLNIRLTAATITSPTVIGTPAAANDDFANRTTLTGTAVSGIGYNFSATRESFEPTTTGNMTLWWTWTAPSSGNVTFSTAGTSAGATLSVFNGDTIDTLKANYAGLTGGGTLTTPTIAGVTYQIAVGTDDPASVVVNVNVAAKDLAPPAYVESEAAANDDFAQAAVLSGGAVTGFGFNQDATRESLEPSGTGDATLWWSWTAPASGTLTVDPSSTTYNNITAAFTGSSLSGLTLIGYSQSAYAYVYSPPPSFTIPVTQGTTYHFSVGATGVPSAGIAVLTLELAASGSIRSFFDGSVSLGNNVFYSATFGYFSTRYFPYIYHFDLGFLYFIDAADGNGGAYFYDFGSSRGSLGFFYTSLTFPFPYLYDFQLGTLLYYFPDTTRGTGYYTTNPRVFSRIDNKQILYY